MTTSHLTTSQTDDLNDPENLDHYFDTASAGLLLLDRKVRVKKANQEIGHFIEKSPETFAGLSYGEGLGCIHIGDHPDGCGYGSICGDCFVHKAIKQCFKTKQPVQDVVGALAIGNSKGVQRPQWSVNALPVSNQGRLHVLISIVNDEGVDDANKI